MTKNVYVSYAWEKKCEAILAQLELLAESRNIKLIYDKKNLKYKGSIKDFTHLIGQAKYVILIISNNYFKSEYCMFELINIDKQGNLSKRIFPIVLPNVKIYNLKDRLKLINHWRNIILEIENETDTISFLRKSNLGESITIYSEIYNNIDRLTEILADINNYSFFMHKKPDYKPVLDAIEASQCSLEEDEKIFKENPKKLFSEFSRQTYIINLLLKWINENKVFLTNELINTLIAHKEKYNSYPLMNLENRDILKKSILEHFDWIVAVLDFQDKSIPLNKYINISPIICESYAPYKDIFTKLLEKLEIENNTNIPPKECIPYLLDLIKVLISKY